MCATCLKGQTNLVPSFTGFTCLWDETTMKPHLKSGEKILNKELYSQTTIYCTYQQSRTSYLLSKHFSVLQSPPLHSQTTSERKNDICSVFKCVFHNKSETEKRGETRKQQYITYNNYKIYDTWSTLDFRGWIGTAITLAKLGQNTGQAAILKIIVAVFYHILPIITFCPPVVFFASPRCEGQCHQSFQIRSLPRLSIKHAATVAK